MFENSKRVIQSNMIRHEPKIYEECFTGVKVRHNYCSDYITQVSMLPESIRTVLRGMPVFNIKGTMAIVSAPAPNGIVLYHYKPMTSRYADLCGHTKHFVNFAYSTPRTEHSVYEKGGDIDAGGNAPLTLASTVTVTVHDHDKMQVRETVQIEYLYYPNIGKVPVQYCMVTAVHDEGKIDRLETYRYDISVQVVNGIRTFEISLNGTVISTAEFKGFELIRSTEGTKEAKYTYGRCSSTVIADGDDYNRVDVQYDMSKAINTRFQSSIDGIRFDEDYVSKHDDFVIAYDQERIHYYMRESTVQMVVTYTDDDMKVLYHLGVWYVKPCVEMFRIMMKMAELRITA